jgi:hypothetical protein
VESISHSLSLEQNTWTTQIQCSQVTTFGLGPLVTPPGFAGRRRARQVRSKS